LKKIKITDESEDYDISISINTKKEEKYYDTKKLTVAIYEALNSIEKVLEGKSN
jgi:hypothetical protein